MPILQVTDRDGVQHAVQMRAGDPLMFALRDGGFGIEATCDGGGICATCHVYLESGWGSDVPEPDVFEEMQLEGLVHRQDESRLACQVIASDAMDGNSLRIAPEEF